MSAAEEAGPAEEAGAPEAVNVLIPLYWSTGYPARAST